MLLLQQPTRLFFGVGAAERCAPELAGLGLKRIFVVSSPSAARAAAAAIASWREGGRTVQVCAIVNREPEIALFEQVLAAARAFRPDAVIGVGGGSPLDVAKLVAALVDSDQPVAATFGLEQLRSRSVYLACLPTTAGTGSEVSPNAVLLDEGAKLKKAAVSRHLVADAAFCDPLLTLGLPPAATAATGIDALVHCMEGYANKAADPWVDVYALEGIRRISGSIVTAVTRGTDLAARTEVLMGAILGGFCLGPVNTAAVHALAYPLGGRYRIAHGVANSLLVPHVFRFNLPAMPERYGAIAVALGVRGDAADPGVAERGLKRLEEISRQCGIPARLRDLGVPEPDIPELAAEAMTVQRLLKNNPRAMTLADAEAIFREAY